MKEALTSHSTREPLIRIEEISSFTQMDEDAVNLALRFMQDHGLIVWLKAERLYNFVFIRPQWIVDILRAVLRHDMLKTEHENPGRFDSLQSVIADFDTEKRKLETKALSRRSTFSELWKAEGLELTAPVESLCIDLLQFLDLCHGNVEGEPDYFRFPFYFITKPNVEEQRLS